MIDNTQDVRIVQQLNSKIKRYTIINSLINKYGFKSYLEIGIFDGYTFKQVNCQTKHGVDPGAEGVSSNLVTHRMTSDEFFDICIDTYDIIFIDGLHLYQQVIKDFNNSIKHLRSGGFILLHDCNPVDELSQNPIRQTVSWNGDVWKAFLLIKKENPHAFVLDTDFGIGVVPSKNSLNCINDTNMDVSWEDFASNRQSLLSLVDVNNIDSIWLNRV